MFAGQDHIVDKIPCQDYADYTITEKGVYVAALADGASGAAFADIAAMCNVSGALGAIHKIDFDKLYSASDREISDFFISACRAYIYEYRKKIKGSELRDFAATLLVLVSDGQKMLLCHLGDGVICGVDNKNNILLLSSPTNIGNARDQTYFTVSNSAELMLSVTRVEDILRYSAFILMSDGPETSFFDYTLNQMRTKNLLTIVDDIGKERAREIELTYFLKSNFWKHGITGDDCSMVVFARESDVE